LFKLIVAASLKNIYKNIYYAPLCQHNGAWVGTCWEKVHWWPLYILRNLRFTQHWSWGFWPSGMFQKHVLVTPLSLRVGRSKKNQGPTNLWSWSLHVPSQRRDMWNYPLYSITCRKTRNLHCIFT